MSGNGRGDGQRVGRHAVGGGVCKKSMKKISFIMAYFMVQVLVDLRSPDIIMEGNWI